MKSVLEASRRKLGLATAFSVVVATQTTKSFTGPITAGVKVDIGGRR
jgi:hypothetical protein